MMATSSMIVFVIGGVLAAAVAIGVYVWYALALSKLFPRLGGEGWKGWVPILNESEILARGGVPAWSVVFYFIPLVNLYGLYLKIVATHRINVSRGRGAGSTVLAILLPPVWATLLAWGPEVAPDHGRVAAPVADARTAHVMNPAVARDASGYTIPSLMPPAAPSAPLPVAPAATGVPPVPGIPAPAAPGAPTAHFAPPAPTTAAPAAPPAAPTIPAAAAAAAPPPAAGYAAPPVPPVHPQGQSPAPPAAPAPQPVAPAQPAPVPSFAPPAAPAAPAAVTPPATPTTPPVPPTTPSVGQPGAVRPAPPMFAPEAPSAAAPAPVLPEAPIVHPPVLEQPVPVPGAAAPVASVLLGADALPEDVDRTVVTPRRTDDEDLEATVVVDRRSRMRWHLVLEDGTRLPLTGEAVVLGRNPDAAPGEQKLAVPDRTRTLSKTHARLDLQGEEWRLTDLHSTNGVVLVADDGTETLLDPGESVMGTGRFILGEVALQVVRDSAS